MSLPHPAGLINGSKPPGTDVERIAQTIRSQKVS
jgi:hypothetical protein